MRRRDICQTIQSLIQFGFCSADNKSSVRSISIAGAFRVSEYGFQHTGICRIQSDRSVDDAQADLNVGSSVIHIRQRNQISVRRRECQRGDLILVDDLRTGHSIDRVVISLDDVNFDGVVIRESATHWACPPFVTRNNLKRSERPGSICGEPRNKVESKAIQSGVDICDSAREYQRRVFHSVVGWVDGIERQPGCRSESDRARRSRQRDTQYSGIDSRLININIADRQQRIIRTRAIENDSRLSVSVLKSLNAWCANDRCSIQFIDGSIVVGGHGHVDRGCVSDL